MAKRKTAPKRKPKAKLPEFKPWAQIWEDVEPDSDEPYWNIDYCVVEYHVQHMRLDAQDLGSALMEAAGITGLDESQIEH